MDKFDRMLKLIEENELIAKKFHEVESKILKILNFKDFFEVLLTEVGIKFGVPYLWLSIVKDSELEDLIDSLQSSIMLKEKINRVDRRTFQMLIGSSETPILLNEHLKPYFKLLPQNTKYFAKSMAFIPISIDDRLIGSFNLADSNVHRFEPGMDTILLERLTLKISLCLSNVVAHEKLKYKAYRDALTGLLNRRVMEKILNREFSRSLRYEVPLSVVFIDLDYFKQVNDTYGHDFGDELLKYTSEIMAKMCRETDIVARFAGDEFVVLLPDTEFQQSALLMQRIQHYFKIHPLMHGNIEISVALSYGISSTEDKNLKTAEQLLKKADENLYEIKKARPQRVCSQ